MGAWPWPPPLKPSTATSFPLLASAPGLPPTTATDPDPLPTEPTATVSARGALMLLTDTASDTESLSPPPLRTATTSTDTSLLPSTPSASPTPASVDLTSRSLVSTPASTMVATTARGPLSPSTEEWLSTLDVLSLPLRGLLRVSALDTATAMGSTATARGPLMPTTELLPLPTL